MVAFDRRSNDADRVTKSTAILGTQFQVLPSLPESPNALSEAYRQLQNRKVATAVKHLLGGWAVAIQESHKYCVSTCNGEKNLPPRARLRTCLEQCEASIKTLQAYGGEIGALTARLHTEATLSEFALLSRGNFLYLQDGQVRSRSELTIGPKDTHGVAHGKSMTLMMGIFVGVNAVGYGLEAIFGAPFWRGAVPMDIENMIRMTGSILLGLASSFRLDYFGWQKLEQEFQRGFTIRLLSYFSERFGEASQDLQALGILYEAATKKPGLSGATLEKMHDLRNLKVGSIRELT